MVTEWSKINGAEMPLNFSRCLWNWKWGPKNHPPLYLSTPSACHPVNLHFVDLSNIHTHGVFHEPLQESVGKPSCGQCIVREGNKSGEVRKQQPESKKKNGKCSWQQGKHVPTKNTCQQVNKQGWKNSDVKETVMLTDLYPYCQFKNHFQIFFFS